MSEKAWYAQLGEFLKRSRKKVGLTQKEVSDKLGYTTGQYVSNIERGVAPPPFPLLPHFSELYGISESEITKVYMDCVKDRIESQFREHKT